MAVAPAVLPETRSDRSVAETASPRRLLYWLWALFWLIMVVVAIQDILHNPYIRWWEPLLWEGSSAASATAWVLFQRRNKDRYSQYLEQPLRWFGYHLRWLPLLIVTFVSSVYAIRHGVYALVGDTYEHESWLFVGIYESCKLTLFTGLWLGIIFGLDSYQQWQAQRRRLLELQRSLAEAQLSQLKAQLRPHFFFNALNTISSLMHVDVARADRMLARLGDLLRVSLQASEQEMTSLREELRTLELYAQIMQERFADRVSIAWQVDESLLDAPTPSLLLQPLLENAFKHGVDRSAGPVKIEISVRRSEEAMIIAIRNTGSTLARDYCDGVGLRNCRERLNLIYGAAASLRLLSDDEAVVVEVTLPRQRHAA